MPPPLPKVIIQLDPSGTYVQSQGRYGPIIRRGRSHKSPGRNSPYRGQWYQNGVLSVSAHNHRYVSWCATIWRVLLTPAQRSAWRIWAHTHKITTEKYNPRHHSAFGAYMYFAKLAMPVVYPRPAFPADPIPNPPLLSPPAGYNPPVLVPMTVGATANVSGVFMYVYCLAGSPPTSQTVICYCAPPGRPGTVAHSALIQGSQATPGHPTLDTPLYFGFGQFYDALRFGERVTFAVRPYNLLTHTPGKLQEYSLVVLNDYH